LALINIERETNVNIKFSASTDGLLREEVSQITKLPSFLQTSAKAVNKPEDASEEQVSNVPDDIASFYQVSTCQQKVKNNHISKKVFYSEN